MEWLLVIVCKYIIIIVVDVLLVSVAPTIDDLFDDEHLCKL